jgi:hypothetical protein
MSDGLASARVTFGRRFHEWAIRQVEDELREGFPLLNRLRNPTAIRYVAWVESLEPTQREPFARAMLDRMFRPYYHALGTDAPRFDPALVDPFLMQGGGIPPARVIAYEIRDDKDFRLPRKTLWSALKAELSPLFPQGFSSVGGGEWQAVNEVGGWKVVTHFDLGGRMRQVGYDHAIRTDPKVGSPALWDYPISAFTWLGVTGQTDLRYFTVDEMPELASTVHEACRRFLDALPDLLDGLSVRGS